MFLLKLPFVHDAGAKMRYKSTLSLSSSVLNTWTWKLFSLSFGNSVYVLVSMMHLYSLWVTKENRFISICLLILVLGQEDIELKSCPNDFTAMQLHVFRFKIDLSKLRIFISGQDVTSSAMTAKTSVEIGIYSYPSGQ